METNNQDEVIRLRMENSKLQEACKLVLLFYSSGHWDDDKRQAWANGMTVLLGPAIERDSKVVGANKDGTWDPALPTNEATTKNLCNAIRAALETKNPPQ